PAAARTAPAPARRSREAISISAENGPRGARSAVTRKTSPAASTSNNYGDSATETINPAGTCFAIRVPSASLLPGFKEKPMPPFVLIQTVGRNDIHVIGEENGGNKFRCELEGRSIRSFHQACLDGTLRWKMLPF